MSKEPKIEFIDRSTETFKTMQKLSRKGLREAGKIVTKIIQDDLNAKHKHTGNMAKAVKARIKVDKESGIPFMELGYLTRKNMKKKYGIKYFVNPSWLEFGTSSHIIQTKQKKSKSIIKLLSYELKDDKGRKFGFEVKHPGEKGIDLLRSTVFSNVDKIKECENEALQAIEQMKIEAGMSVDVDYEEEEVG